MSDRPKDERRAHLRVVSAEVELEPAPVDVVDADPSEEELRGAEALRAALDAAGPGSHEVAALRAAFSPATLGHVDHERLLERALGVAPGAGAPLPPAGLEPASTRAEERAAASLRARVDAGLRPDPDAEPDDEVERLVEVAVALRNAHAPRPIDELTEARLRKVALSGPRRRGRTIATTLAALAVAAAAAVAVLPRVASVTGPATAGLVPARSTQELFDPAEPFAREGGESGRIDRISASRTADLRQNRFARWGVK